MTWWMRAIVRLYPRRWRERYGDELEALVEDCGGGRRHGLDLLQGALAMRLKGPFALAVVLVMLGTTIGGALYFSSPQLQTMTATVRVATGIDDGDLVRRLRASVDQSGIGHASFEAVRQDPAAQGTVVALSIARPSGDQLQADLQRMLPVVETAFDRDDFAFNGRFHPGTRRATSPWVIPVGGILGLAGAALTTIVRQRVEQRG